MAATVVGRAVRMWRAIEWPVWTGTRTVVAATSRSGRSRILRSSALTLRSSPLHPSSKRRSIWGTTESAIRPWNGVSGAGSRPSVARSATKASTPARPAPLTAWYEATSTASRPQRSRMGARATTAAAVVQFGFATSRPS